MQKIITTPQQHEPYSTVWCGWVSHEERYQIPKEYEHHVLMARLQGYYYRSPSDEFVQVLKELKESVI